MIIWRTDSNGKIGGVKAEEQNPRKIIGPYEKQKEASKGNGKSLSIICYQENMITMTTWKQPPLPKQETSKCNKSIPRSQPDKSSNIIEIPG